MVWCCGVISRTLAIVPTTVSQKTYPKNGESWGIWLIKAIQQVKENPLN